MAKHKPLGERPTARELEKVGAATLAHKYAVPISQIILWRKESRERSGMIPAEIRPPDPDRELLERLLAEDPGPTRDERDREAGYTKMGVRDAVTRTPVQGGDSSYELPEDFYTYLPLAWALFLGLMIILLIASGVWK
jgi:hypothetical protein